MTMATPRKPIDLAPKAFIDALAAWPGRGTRKPWRQSKEWAMFRAGYNAAVAAANAATLARYPLPPRQSVRPLLTDRKGEVK